MSVRATRFNRRFTSSREARRDPVETRKAFEDRAPSFPFSVGCLRPLAV